MWSKPPLYLPTKLQKIIEITKDKGKKNKNKCRIIWKLLKFFLSLHRQNECFDYAAECGEQDLIDTTPFKSHLRVAFIFHISF